MPSGTVLTAFKCRISRIQYQPGMEYAHEDVARIEYLRDLGYVSVSPPAIETEEAPALTKTKKTKG